MACVTSWVTTPGLDVIMAVALLRAHVAGAGNLTGHLYYQTASVRTDSPDAWTRLDSQGSPVLAVVGGGTISACSGAVNISSITGSKMFIRFGIGYFTSTAGSAATGDVSLSIQLAQCGQMSGAWSGALSTSTTSAARQVVTGWIPRLLVDKVKAAILVSSRSGNIQVQLAYRTANAMRDTPGGWTPLGSGLTADGILGDTTVGGASDMWVQFAIEYSLSSGSTPGDAFVSVSVGTRRS